MTKLLRADFMRLKKNRLFWLGVIFMFGLGLFVVFNTFYENLKVPEFATSNPDFFFCLGAVFVGIAAAVFIAFFIGTEYGDGTVRNKLIAGHRRGDVYLSELIVCTAASFIMHIAYLLVVIIGGVIFIGAFVTPLVCLLEIALVCFISVLASTALFVMMAMLITSKPASIAALILASIFLLAASAFCYSKLSEPEYFDGYIITSEDINFGETEKIPNPGYPRGAWRKFYGFLFDFLPVGQMLQFSSSLSDIEPISQTELILRVLKFSGYSLILTAASSACGLICFKRKDLK